MGKAEKAEYQRRVRRCTRSLALCSPRFRFVPRKGGLNILARRLLRALDTGRITAIGTAESDKECLSFLPPNLVETMWEQIVAKGTIDVSWIKEQLNLLARAETAEPAVENPEIVPANPVTPQFCPVTPKACPCTPQRAGSSLSPLAYVSPQRRGHIKTRASELWYRTSPTRKKRIATAAVALKAEPKYSARKLDSIRKSLAYKDFCKLDAGTQRFYMGQVVRSKGKVTRRKDAQGVWRCTVTPDDMTLDQLLPVEFPNPNFDKNTWSSKKQRQHEKTHGPGW